MQKKMTITLGILVAGLLAASVVLAKDSTNAPKKSKSASASTADESEQPYYGGKGRRGPGNRGDGYHRRGSGMHRGMLPPYVALTAEQQAAADTIAERSQKAAEPIHTEVQNLRTQMHNEWKANKPNKQKIISINRQIRSLRGKLSERRISDRIEMIALLTPEQRAEMIERMPENPYRDGRGFGNGRGRGNGRGDGRGNGRGNGRGFRDGRGPGGPDCAWNNERRGRGYRTSGGGKQAATGN